MELFDSHAHLESRQFDADREEAIARATNAGVTCILTCGSDLPRSEAAVQLAAAHPGLYAAVGIHGHEARTALLGDDVCSEPREGCFSLLDDTVFERLARLAQQPQVVAIGEIGLDYHYHFSPPDVQRAVLARQLELAHALRLPVILHNRESDQDMRQIVDAGPTDLSGVLHCFLADQAMAEWACERGLYIGVAGPITFKNVRHLPDIIRRVPPDRLLIETDSPFLAPHPKRGQRNEPAYVQYVAEGLARVLDLSLEEVAARSTENARRMLGIA